MRSEVRKLIRQGREYYQSQQYDRAERVLRQALAEDSGMADAHNILGVIYHEKGRYKQARDCFARALELNPAYTEAALNLAVAHNELGDYDAAKRVYAGAIVRTRGEDESIDGFAKGKIANMHADLAEAYYEMGFLEQAARQYREAIALCPSFVDLRSRLGSVLRDLRRYDEAIAEYNEALRIDAGFLQARLQLGITLLSAGSPNKALAEIRRAVEANPASRTAKAFLRMVERRSQTAELGPLTVSQHSPTEKNSG